MVDHPVLTLGQSADRGRRISILHRATATPTRTASTWPPSRSSSWCSSGLWLRVPGMAGTLMGVGALVVRGLRRFS